MEESSTFIWSLTTDYPLKNVKIYRHSNELMGTSPLLISVLSPIIPVSPRVLFVMRYSKFLIGILY